MEEVIIQLDELDRKIRKLAERNRVLKEENETLRQQNEAITGTAGQQEEELKELKKNIAMLRVSSMARESRPDEAAQRIDELVREIDRCIALIDK